MRRPSLTEVFPWLLGLLATVAYATLSILRFRNFTVNSWDNAIFEQAVQGYSKFDAPIVVIKGPGYNILGDHFSPIDAVLGPVYRVFGHGETLLVAQAVLIGISVAVITALAMRHLAWIGAWVGLLYAVSFGLQNAVMADFHEVAFALPFLALAGAAYVDGRFDHVVWWSLPLFLVKEDLGFTVAMIGVALWIVGERRKGLLVGIGGVLGLILVVTVIIPSFNAGNSYDYTDTLGGDGGIVGTFFSHLDTKALTVLITLGVGGLLAVMSPWALLLVPTLLWRYLGGVEFYWGTDWHYSMILMPIVFVALVDVIVQRPWARWPGLAIATGFGVWTVFFMNSAFVPSGSPLTLLADSATWHRDARAEGALAAMKVIPRGSYVESDLGMLKQLVSDYHVYWRGTVGDAVPDYIVFDRRLSDEDPALYGLTAHHHNYEKVFDDGQWIVVARVR